MSRLFKEDDGVSVCIPYASRVLSTVRPLVVSDLARVLHLLGKRKSRASMGLLGNNMDENFQVALRAGMPLMTRPRCSVRRGLRGFLSSRQGMFVPALGTCDRPAHDNVWGR